jgi:hypothetical protein
LGNKYSPNKLPSTALSSSSPHFPSLALILKYLTGVWDLLKDDVNVSFGLRSRRPCNFSAYKIYDKKSVISFLSNQIVSLCISSVDDRLCGLVVRVLDYRCRGPGFDSLALQKKKAVGLERGPLSLVSTTEELLDRKVAAPV